MNLPEKYKGATPGPWRIEADKDVIAGTTDGFPFDPVARFNVSGRVELDSANALLIADAPMLACRVAVLEEALGNMVKFAERVRRVRNAHSVTYLCGDSIPEEVEARTILAASPFRLAPDPESQDRADHEGRARRPRGPGAMSTKPIRFMLTINGKPAFWSDRDGQIVFAHGDRWTPVRFMESREECRRAIKRSTEQRQAWGLDEDGSKYGIMRCVI